MQAYGQYATTKMKYGILTKRKKEIWHSPEKEDLKNSVSYRIHMIMY